MNSNNNQINNTGETQNQNQFPGLVDKLTILPCTQERVAGLNILELEQQPATNGKQLNRDDMYNLWRMNKTVDQVFDKNDGRKNAFFFGYPINNFKSYFSGSNSFFSSSKKTCKDIKTADKWKMYAEYINKSAMNNNPTTCVIVSHHNRMKKKGNTFDTTDPLIPLIKTEKAKANPDCNKECNAYANNFTVRIEIEKPNENGVKIDIVDPGFPDKGAFTSNEACNNNTVEENEQVEQDINKGGGKKYLYCTKDSSNEIDYTKLKGWLTNAFSSSGQKGKVVIYFIRHGNSIHNKPTNQKMVDSSLTYLGMIQAAQLGYNIANYKEEGQDLCQDFINPDAQPKVLLCGSFLSRTQLTGLIFLSSLYRSCTQKNNNISNTNTIDNITDVLTNGDMYFGTNLQDAWNYLMKTAVKNQQDKMHKIDEYIKYEPLQSIITNRDYTQANEQAYIIYEALQTKYSSSTTGGRKTKKHKRKSRKMTRKVRVKRASKRVNKKASKKGHKKRSKRVRKM
jgi:hypothetical protein